MAGGFRRDHGDVDILRRHDGLEVNAEAVREHQRFTCRQIRRDVGLINIGLQMIRHQDHDRVRGLRRFGRRQYSQAGRGGLRAALARFRQADHDVQSRITQVQRMRMALAAVADDGNLLCP